MSRDERDVIVVERERGGLGWLVFGAALGAGLALLFTPKTGKEFRRELGKRVRGARELAGDALDEVKDEFGSEDPGAPDQTDDIEVEDDLDTPEPVERESRPRVVGAREELERRLEAARARRRDAEPEDEDEEPVA